MRAVGLLMRNLDARPAGFEPATGGLEVRDDRVSPGATSSHKVPHLQVFRRLEWVGVCRYMPLYAGPVVVRVVVNVRPDARIPIAPRSWQRYGADERTRIADLLITSDKRPRQLAGNLSLVSTLRGIAQPSGYPLTRTLLAYWRSLLSYSASYGRWFHRPSASTIRDQSPSLSHLRYLPRIVLVGSNSSSGRSCHEEPVSMIHKIPQSTCRSSRLGRPRPGFCFGNSTLTRSHSASARRPPFLTWTAILGVPPSPGSVRSGPPLLLLLWPSRSMRCIWSMVVACFLPWFAL